MPEPTLSDVLSAIATVHDSLAQVRGEVARLREEVASFRDDHLVTPARIECIDQVARAMTQAFEKEINGMHRQILNLQEEVRQLRRGH
jgi:uncharacterized coiled-coil DUF342 family protein